MTVDVATLGDGMSTRYRAEHNVKLPGLESMTPDDVKKTIDAGVANPAFASVVVSKTVKLGITPEEGDTYPTSVRAPRPSPKPRPGSEDSIAINALVALGIERVRPLDGGLGVHHRLTEAS